MKTSISTIVGLAIAAMTLTTASAQDARYSTKPWLHPRQMDTATKGVVAPASTVAKPSVASQNYSSKPWLKPQREFREFQIALFPEGATVTSQKTATRSERAVNPRDYSSKPWLR